MGPFPHDAPPAEITPENPAGTDGFGFVEYAHPEPEKLHSLFRTMGFEPVARHRDKAITLYQQGDVNYLVNEEPGSHAARFAAAHGPCASSMAFRVVDAKHAYRRALELGAEPADPARARWRWTCPRSRASAARCSTSWTATAPRARRSMPSSSGPALPIPGQHGQGLFYLDHLTHNVGRGRMDLWAGFYERLFNFKEIRLLRHQGRVHGPVLARPDQPRRQDPHPDQRVGRRAEPDRGVPARVQGRGHPAHRLRLPRHLHDDRGAARARARLHALAAAHLLRAGRRARARPRRGPGPAAAQRHPARRRGGGGPRREGGPDDQGAAADLLGQRRSGRSSSSSSSARATRASARATSAPCSSRSRRTSSAAACWRARAWRGQA